MHQSLLTEILDGRVFKIYRSDFDSNFLKRPISICLKNWHSFPLFLSAIDCLIESLGRVNVDFAMFSAFLDASTHLYKRVCPSVGPSVRCSIHNHFFKRVNLVERSLVIITEQCIYSSSGWPLRLSALAPILSCWLPDPLASYPSPLTGLPEHLGEKRRLRISLWYHRSSPPAGPLPRDN